MNPLYSISIRRYTPGEDEDESFACDSITEAFEFIGKQNQFGPFRAWVNGREIKRACNGVTFQEFLSLVDGKLGAAAEAFGKFLSSNPATYRALGAGL